MNQHLLKFVYKLQIIFYCNLQKFYYVSDNAGVEVVYI